MRLASDLLKTEQQAESRDFEAIFRLHWSEICSLAARLLRDRFEAEDVALEAFWRLWRIKALHLEHPRSWLYRVATHLALNVLRAKNRKARKEQAAAAGHIDASGDWTEEVERREQDQLVQEVLGSMKRRSAQLLLLRYSGQSYSEIGKALGVAPTSVGTLLARAEKDFASRFLKKKR